MIIGLLRTFLFLIIIYYLFRFIGRLVLPTLLSKYVNKMTNPNFQKQQYSEGVRNDEGKVTIKQTAPHKKMTSSDLGEYVDYEEVKG
ncbi:DUF4834 family protein [Plebeiibacterium sediminum]